MKIVHLDDDHIIRKHWITAAKASGLEIHSFECPQQLLSQLESFEEDTYFYLDHDLCSNLDGIDVAKILREEGMSEIYICQEMGQNIRTQFPLISKMPPWETAQIS